jgi:hypothetical protein
MQDGKYKKRTWAKYISRPWVDNLCSIAKSSPLGIWDNHMHRFEKDV